MYSVLLPYGLRSVWLVPSCDFRKVELGWGFRFLSLLQIRHLGPMIQQTQGMCASCKGQGRSIEPSKRCKTCGGKGVCKERKILQIFIEKGECECGDTDVLRCAVGCRCPNSQTDLPRKLALSNSFGRVSVVFRVYAGVKNHHKIAFRGEADERPGEIPGDVVLVVEQQASTEKNSGFVFFPWQPFWRNHGRRWGCLTAVGDCFCSLENEFLYFPVIQEHELFKRRGNDLFMTKKITLYEALCGFKFLLTHLDGRQLLIQVRACLSTSTDSFVKPNSRGPNWRLSAFLDLRCRGSRRLIGFLPVPLPRALFHRQLGAVP